VSSPDTARCDNARGTFRFRDESWASRETIFR
jgi:hypothetical protein